MTDPWKGFKAPEEPKDCYVMSRTYPSGASIQGPFTLSEAIIRREIWQERMQDVNAATILVPFIEPEVTP